MCARQARFRSFWFFRFEIFLRTLEFFGLEFRPNGTFNDERADMTEISYCSTDKGPQFNWHRKPPAQSYSKPERHPNEDTSASELNDSRASRGTEVDPDLSIISKLGQATVADILGISRKAVSKWWRKGAIPDSRRDEIRQLRNHTELTGQPPIQPVSTRSIGLANNQSTHQPPYDINLPMADGPGSIAEANVVIAKRLAELAGDRADQARQTLSPDAQDEPVRGYALRLALLFTSDFPVLTMAFESVARASPIVAAGSAVAFSLFLVIGAHLLGGTLRGSVTKFAGVFPFEGSEPAQAGQ